MCADEEKQSEEQRQKEIKEYLLNYQEQAWQSFQHHKSQIHKLAYWSSGFIFAVIGLIRFLPKAPVFIDNIQLSLFTVITVYSVIVGLLYCIIHHHLAVGFYSKLLREINTIIVNNFYPEKLFAKLKSPYVMYYEIFCRELKPLPSRISDFALVGSVIYILCLVGGTLYIVTTIAPLPLPVLYLLTLFTATAIYITWKVYNKKQNEYGKQISKKLHEIKSIVKNLNKK